jgi:anti-anti-sigma factor
MPKPLLRITTTRSDAETVIKLSGECDVSNVEDLKTTVYNILVSERRRIILDVEELDFMGSCGLTPILRAIDGLQPHGGVVVVKKPTRTLRWLLDYFGIAEKAIVVD